VQQWWQSGAGGGRQRREAGENGRCRQENGGAAGPQVYARPRSGGGAAGAGRRAGRQWQETGRQRVVQAGENQVQCSGEQVRQNSDSIASTVLEVKRRFVCSRVVVMTSFCPTEEEAGERNGRGTAGSYVMEKCRVPVPETRCPIAHPR